MSSPGVIRKLDETLVNRIAAGEVVQRPVNALKELLENSLDAKATDIIIRVQYGSMKFMQIQDNGTGIRKEDLSIVCERFTTSKLSQFEDLNKISTFGFRGEALASISHVAHLSIVTKTADEQCAYIARYRDGKLIKAPTPTAGNQGTQITVEDLFYNVPTRRQALKNASDEYYRILDMVGSYAIHNPQVGFAVKKQGDPIAVLRTPSGSTHIENIKEIHGMKVSRELLEIDHNDTGLRFSLHGFITNVNYSTKKQAFLLFINNRLVDSTGLRKALDSIYSLYLPKGSHPFMYISLTLDPRIVDVNVHPTKHEVHFLHEDSIIEKVRQVVDSRLSGANVSRVFRTQTKPAGSNDIVKTASTSCSDNPSHMVRTDSSAQKIDKFFTSTPSEVSPSSQPYNEMSLQYGTYKIRNVKLTSVLNLREEIEEDCSSVLREIFSNLVFVGCVDKTRALIQCKEELYLCNTEKMLEELFYQIVLYTFGGIGELVLENKLPLISLMNTALECERVCDIADNREKDKLAFSSVELLKSKGPMLYDYFSMKIDDDGNLLTLPYLLNDYLPDMGGLPLYIYGLATAVNWDNEKECFRTFSRETAKFYSRVATKCKEGNEDWQWVTEHVVYHTVREGFRPPKHFGEDFLVQLTSIPELYKVFERC